MRRIRRPLPRRLTAGLTAGLAAALALGVAGCDAVEEAADDAKRDATAEATSDATSDATAEPSADDPRPGRAVSPLDNPDGTKPGLAPLTADADREAGLQVIDRLATKGRGPRTGYDREEFGYAWMDGADGVPLAGNGCDTRNDILARDGLDPARSGGDDCVIESMTLPDPYTGTTVDFRREDPMEVQIDHVVPMSYAWQLGAARWPEDERERFANDPLNLLPVDGGANSAKQDSGPASWLPPDKRIRCAYAVRFAQVALAYELPVTGPDKKAMRAQCATG